jgi:osmotically-inducible protein OsmY
MILIVLPRVVCGALSAVFLAASVSLLNGCIPLVVGGVAATAVVATDRRSTGTQLDDEFIEDKTVATVLERYGRSVHVNVTSYNGIVLLSGEVPTESTKEGIADIVRGWSKTRNLQNDLVVGPLTDLSSRSNDTFITSKVKARFVEANRFQINHVKVVTERGVVYLMGIVRRDEGDAAADIARTTRGVQRVVKLFDYIT